MMNRRFFLIVSLLFIAMTVAAQRAKKIHFKSILVDTHNDIPETALAKGLSFDQSLKGRTHSDLQRMREGNLGREPRPGRKRCRVPEIGDGQCSR